MRDAKKVGIAAQCHAVVVWIDWYAYHLARFEGLQAAFGSNGEVVGLEMVGGIGVHAGLKFREERPAGLPIETLMPDSGWRDASKLTLSRMLWSRLSELDPEIVLVPGYYTLPAVVAALWARTHGRQSVLMTESTAGDHTRSWWKERIKSGLIRLLFNWAVTGGAAHVRYLRQLHVPADRIARFYDVVGNKALSEAAAQLRKGSDAAANELPVPYFLFVGRLAKEKNVEGLLRAWTAYREQGGTWSLVIAGSGPERDSLEAIVSATQYRDDVLFTGHKTSQQLIPFFSFAACFVLPSTREPWGLVVNEAMAAALPVLVSTRCGCAEDLVQQGRNGFVFDPENGAEFVECLWAMERSSPAERAAMGASSAEIINPFSPSNFGLEIAAIRGATHKRSASSLRPEQIA